MNYEPFDITRGRDYERTLQRIATRGIVQLFNTVRKQQQQQNSSSTKRKKENTINKGEFLDMLKTIDSDEVSCKIMKKNPKMVKWKFYRDVFFFKKKCLFRMNNQLNQHQSDGMFFKMISWPVLKMMMMMTMMIDCFFVIFIIKYE